MSCDADEVCVAPGAAARERIQDAIDAQSAKWAIDSRRHVVRLHNAEYVIDAGLTWKSGVSLVGVPDGSRLTAGWTMPVGGADDPANRLIGAVATEDGWTSTLATPVKKNTRLLSLVSASGLLVGDYLWLRGYTPLSQDSLHAEDGGLVFRCEVVKIQSIVGNDVTLVRPTLDAHGTAPTVSVARVVPVRQIAIDGVELDGANAAAAGIVATGALGLELDRVAGRNLTRGLVTLDRGTYDVAMFRLRDGGGMNGLIYGEAAHGVSLSGASADEDASRGNTLGVKRPKIFAWAHPTAWRVLDSTLANGDVGGLFASGPRNWTISRVHARNMEMTSTAFAAMDPIQVMPGGLVGLGFGFGTGPSGPLSANERGYGITMTDCTGEDLAGPEEWATEPHRCCFAYVHDISEISLGGNRYVNRGRTTKVGAFYVSDCDGHVQASTATGCNYGWFSNNVYEDLSVDGLHINGLGLYPIPVLATHHYTLAAGGVGGGMELRGVRQNNCLGNGFKAAGEFAPDPLFRVRDYTSDAGRRYEVCRIGTNLTGAQVFPGEVVEQSAVPSESDDAMPAVVNPTGTAGARLYVVASAAYAGYPLLLAELPQRCHVLVRAGDEVRHGDPLEPVGGTGADRRQWKRATAAPILRAAAYKASGAVQAVFAGYP